MLAPLILLLYPIALVIVMKLFQLLDQKNKPLLCGIIFTVSYFLIHSIEFAMIFTGYEVGTGIPVMWALVICFFALIIFGIVSKIKSEKRTPAKFVGTMLLTVLLGTPVMFSSMFMGGFLMLVFLLMGGDPDFYP